jgi:hypothetical protein
MNNSTGLTGFKTKEPQEIIFDVYRIRQRMLMGEELEMPLIMLFLFPEGKEVSGYVLDVKEEKGQYSAAIQLGGQQSSNDIFYVYLGAIRGVTIHDIDRYESIFSEVTAETKMNCSPGTTKLDVRKRIEKDQTKLKEKAGLSVTYNIEGDLPDGDVGLFVICNLISDVTVCLIELSQTVLGKEAIMEGVKKVTFKKTNSDFSLTRKNGEVIIQGTLNRSFTTTERRWKLKDLIEGVL